MLAQEKPLIIHEIGLMQTILVPYNAGFSMLWCFTGLYNDRLIFITHSRTFVGNLDIEPDNLMTDLISILSNLSLLGKN